MFNKKESYLLAVFAITFSMFNTNVVAQDEVADDNVEDVIVTGTRLKSDGFEAVSPVAVVTADNIKKTGLVIENHTWVKIEWLISFKDSQQ